MSFHEFFRKFFDDIAGGNMRPPEYDDGRNWYGQKREPGNEDSMKPDYYDESRNWFGRPRSPPWESGSEDRLGSFNPGFDFKIITDSFEMDQQMIEKQINEVFKMFSGGFPGLSGPDFFGFSNVPAIEESKDPRDHCLKPGTSKPQPNDGNLEKDSIKRSGWLDAVVPSGSPLQDGLAHPRTFSSFRSVVRKTVTLPDGTVKTEEVIRNSDGTEERTESHSKPDKPGDPVVMPDVSGFFRYPKMSETKLNKLPKDEFLKFGYEKFNPDEAKIDKDLDKQILQSGIDILPPFQKEPTLAQNFSFRSVTRRQVILPNGVVETEEIVRSPDGTEQRTVTQTLPDGTTQGSNNMSKMEDLQAFQSFTLKGVKDLIDTFFK